MVIKIKDTAATAWQATEFSPWYNKLEIFYKNSRINSKAPTNTCTQKCSKVKFGLEF